MGNGHRCGRPAGQQHLSADIGGRSPVCTHAIDHVPPQDAEARHGEVAGSAEDEPVEPSHGRTARPPPRGVSRRIELRVDGIVTLARLPHERRQRVGWMLQVVVHAHDVVADGRTKAGKKCRMLPAVARQCNDPEPGVNAGPLTQDGGAAVTAAVVHGDDLVRPAFLLARLDDAIDRLADHRGAVVDGNDDRDHGTTAIARRGPPLPPASFIGRATTSHVGSGARRAMATRNRHVRGRVRMGAA